ncbi:MAG: tetratricopeptide repeat protein [Candidatus Riflebacteria bacterium]|nr:tetratricopeptide repeat protein [Candidatus Riflebacteria bacterium]
MKLAKSLLLYPGKNINNPESTMEMNFLPKQLYFFSNHSTSSLVTSLLKPLSPLAMKLVHLSCLLTKFSIAFIFLFYSLPLSGLTLTLGEDAPLKNGLVISVNSFVRSPFTGGLTTQDKLDKVEISLTFVNTGKKQFSIDPSTNFVLSLENKYPLENEKDPGCLFNTIALHPGTQSRGKLLFKVKAVDKNFSPLLIFSHDELGNIEISCDSDLSKLFEKSKTIPLELEEVLKLGKFFIESDRKEEAEKFLRGAYTRFGDEPHLLVLLATLAKNSNDICRAGELISKVTPTSESDPSLGNKESLQIAKDAFELGQFDACAKILEPLFEKKALEDKDLIFLGRCWYFQKNYEKAKDLLSDLDSRGFRDSQLYFTLANIYDKVGDPNSAISFWEKTLEVEPTNYESMFNIGVGYFKQGDQQKAKEYWEKTLELNPDEDTKKIIEDALKKLN